MKPHVRLCPMTDEDYSRFSERQVVEYAYQLWRAGEVQEVDMFARSRVLQDDLLQDRLRGNGHSFLVAMSEESLPVGYLWVSPCPAFLQPRPSLNMRWLTQITVSDELRGLGWGKAIHHSLEAHLLRLEVRELWLRVFNWNTVARSFYRSLGYVVVEEFDNDVHLKKVLGTQSPLD